MKTLQNIRHRAKLFLGFFLALSTIGFIAVFIGVIAVNIVNTLVTMVILGIAAVVLGVIIAVIVIPEIAISLLNNNPDQGGDETSQTSIFTPEHG